MVKKKYILVDGYNVIHKIPELEEKLDVSLEQARDGLVAMCNQWIALRKDYEGIMVVFDGKSHIGRTDFASFGNVKMIYTETGETADDRIVHICRENMKTHEFLVITDDRAVQSGSRINNASVISVSRFLGVQRAKKAKAANQNIDDRKLSPDQMRRINATLAKEWGIE